MPYATATDLSSAIGTPEYLAIADRDRDGAVAGADLAAVTAALEDASATADSYLGRYLPISTVPAALRKAVIRLAVYDLAGNHATDEQRRKHEDALTWLRDIGAGKAKLSQPTEEADPDEDLDIRVDAREPHFGYDERGWERGW